MCVVLPATGPAELMAYWLPEEWHRLPEIDTVNTAAAGLYARCGSFIADSETDGFIPAARARMYGTAEWIERLVDVGMWSVVDGGYRDEHYFPLNKTKAEKQKAKKDAAVRQARRRATVTRESRVTHASRHPGVSTPPFPPPSGGKGLGPREPHAYVDDGQGCCESCGLIPANRAHLRAV